MNKRIKKKKWKQAAARSRAERLEEIRLYGADDIRTIQSCFGHFVLFGEQLLDTGPKRPMVPIELPAELLDDVIGRVVEEATKWAEENRILPGDLKLEVPGPDKDKYVLRRRRIDE